MLVSPRIDDYEWGAMIWLAGGEAVGASLATMTLCAHQTSTLHRHGNCNEIIHVTRGEVSQRIGDVWQAMRSGETAFIPAGTIHQTKNLTDQDAEMTICYSSGVRDFEEVSA